MSITFTCIVTHYNTTETGKFTLDYTISAHLAEVNLRQQLFVCKKCSDKSLYERHSHNSLL